MRQGSLLGGLLWTIYLDSLLTDLQNSGNGCYINGTWIGAVIYADDICLISSTSVGLSTLIDITEKFAAEHQITLNPNKSKLMICGPAKHLNLRATVVCGKVVNPVTSLRYLGFELSVNRTRTISVEANLALRKMYCSANAIFSIPGCTKPLLRLRIIKALALPHADYVLSLWRFMSPAARKLVHSAVNRVLRRCLGLHTTCSGDLVCCVAGAAHTPMRAGHLMINSVHHHGLCANTLEVLRLRDTGLAGKLAARVVATAAVSPAHTECARCIRALLTSPDAYARRMAYNISVPSSLINRL